MGASGDMIMAALLDMLDEAAARAFIARMNGLSLHGVTLAMGRAEKCGITGMGVSVTVNGREELSHDASVTGHEKPCGHGQNHALEHTHAHGCAAAKHHAHNGLADIAGIIERLQISQTVKDNALGIFRLLAGAEAAVHGRPVDQVHFHEVGSMDAVADILGVCMLMEEFSPSRIYASPVHVGAGHVRCAHGVLPVPAPATAYILRDVPAYGGGVQGELCTPTGAAILKHFVGDNFGPMPVIAAKAVGYGMGKKDFAAANCLRAFYGTMAGTGGAVLAGEGPNGSIVELCCNVDDMTGEAVAFAGEALLAAGALDFYILPAQMKKGRPGQHIICLCETNDADRMAAALLRYTTTFGVRRVSYEKYMLRRESTILATPYGDVREKTGCGYGVNKTKLEYEDVAARARQLGVGIPDLIGRMKVENVKADGTKTD
jgi:uncharacterized protein (TIGR00299 family) protein